MLEKINNDIKNSMRDKDTFKLSNLRLVKGAIQLESINKKKDLTDDEIIDIISKQIKSRKDSILEFQKGNRKDLIEKTNLEIEFLMRYMPTQLTIDEIKEIVKKTIEEVGAITKKDIGKVMSVLLPKVKGKVDMGIVNKLINEILE